ncbi:MAG: HVA1 family protein [Pseudomonadota bacterium]
MAGYNQGANVERDWGDGTASGEIREVYTQKRTLKIDGSEVTRDASDECPAYKIEQDDGQTVLKSHSEVRKLS